MSSFVSRLEAVGKGLLGFFNTVEASPLAGLIPGGAFFGRLINTVEGTERAAVVFEETLGTKVPGEVKAKAVLPLVKQLLQSYEVLGGQEIGDDALFEQAAQHYVDGTVAFLKSIKHK